MAKASRSSQVLQDLEGGAPRSLRLSRVVYYIRDIEVEGSIPRAYESCEEKKGSTRGSVGAQGPLTTAGRYIPRPQNNAF